LCNVLNACDSSYFLLLRFACFCLAAALFISPQALQPHVLVMLVQSKEGILTELLFLLLYCATFYHNPNPKSNLNANILVAQCSK